MTLEWGDYKEMMRCWLRLDGWPARTHDFTTAKHQAWKREQIS